MSLQPTPPSLSGRSDGRAEESNVRARESRKAGAAGSGGWGTPFFCHSEAPYGIGYGLCMASGRMDQQKKVGGSPAKFSKNSEFQAIDQTKAVREIQSAPLRYIFCEALLMRGKNIE